jgi:hypothetical protein
MIDITGIDKADLVAQLYNKARTQGMGFLQYDPKPMTLEEGSKYVGTYIDYLKGRVMKIKVDGDSVDEGGYDRDNGSGSVAKIVEELRGGL